MSSTSAVISIIKHEDVEGQVNCPNGHAGLNLSTCNEDCYTKTLPADELEWQLKILGAYHANGCDLQKALHSLITSGDVVDKSDE